MQPLSKLYSSFLSAVNRQPNLAPPMTAANASRASEKDKKEQALNAQEQAQRDRQQQISLAYKECMEKINKSMILGDDHTFCFSDISIDIVKDLNAQGLRVNYVFPGETMRQSAMNARLLPWDAQFARPYIVISWGNNQNPEDAIKTYTRKALHDCIEMFTQRNEMIPYFKHKPHVSQLKKLLEMELSVKPEITSEGLPFLGVEIHAKSNKDE